MNMKAKKKLISSIQDSVKRRTRDRLGYPVQEVLTLYDNHDLSKVEGVLGTPRDIFFL